MGWDGIGRRFVILLDSISHRRMYSKWRCTDRKQRYDWRRLFDSACFVCRTSPSKLGMTLGIGEEQ